MRYLLMMLPLIACAPTPKERYIQAVNQKMSGDAQGYYEDLLALAHDAPDSRAGRRARATLANNAWLTQALGLGLLSVAAKPLLDTLPNASAVSVEAGLRSLSDALHAFQREHERFCVTFEECDWQPPHGSRHVFFLSFEVTAAGERVDDPATTEAMAAAMLSAIDRRPMAAMQSFLIAAAANLDDDTQLDLWTMDDAGQVEHLP